MKQPVKVQKRCKNRDKLKKVVLRIPEKLKKDYLGVKMY